MKTFGSTSGSRIPASRFPEPADIYFCDNCGTDLTKNLYRDRAPVWQPLRPIWCVCKCGRKYLSGAAEWDDLSTWERKQRIQQLWIGFVLFAILVLPATLAYFALRYGGAALLAVVGIALIPSILAAKPFGFVLLDLQEIIVSLWRTRINRRRAASATTIQDWIRRSRLHKFQFSPAAAVIAVLIVATHWIPPHLGPAIPMRASLSPEKSNVVPQQTLAPSRLSFSRTARTADTGAPSSAFKRVDVGPNEIDYIAEDVTIRHFIPAHVRPRAPRPPKEIHLGSDVTIRYFASNAEADAGIRLEPVHLSLPFSK